MKSTERRLFQYALKYKKGIILGLVCLMIAVALELAGPLIAKRVIDNHILGVEGYWEAVETADDTTAPYHEQLLKRSDRVENEDTPTGATYTLLQIGISYYVFEGELPLTGEREMNNGELTIISNNDIVRAEGERLSVQEAYPFFEPEKTPIIGLLVLYMVLLIIAGVFQFYQTFLLQKSANQIVKRMRTDLFAHTERLPINYYIDQPAGTIVARITNDTEAIRDLYERVLSIVVASLVYMAGIFIALFILDPQLAALCLLVIPLLYGWMRFYKYFGGKYNRDPEND